MQGAERGIFNLTSTTDVAALYDKGVYLGSGAGKGYMEHSQIGLNALSAETIKRTQGAAVIAWVRNWFKKSQSTLSAIPSRWKSMAAPSYKGIKLALIEEGMR